MWKDEGVIRDTAAIESVLEDEWVGSSCKGCQSWHPGPEHCGDLQFHGSRRARSNFNSNNIDDNHYYDDYSDSYTTRGSSTFMHTTYNHYSNDYTTHGSSTSIHTTEFDCFHSSKGRVICTSNCHRHSSRRRWGNWSCSFGLSVVIYPASLPPHEWQLYGVEKWELMSPPEATPTAKLVHRPRRLCHIAKGTCHYSTHEGVRARLAPFHPSIGTCPSLIIVAGDTSGAHIVLPQAQWRDAGQAQTQGCRGPLSCQQYAICSPNLACG